MSDSREKFLKLYRENIHRPGADALLDYLCSPACDFFTAPASTRYHGAYAGGLCEHSINVYECLKDYLKRPRVQELYHLHCSEESLAVISLLHDVCKINCYKPSFRNVKDENGVWKKVPTFEFDDPLPYGHGEKSVYIIGGFLRLSREEAFAIRFHMGFSGSEEVRLVGNAFERFPLAFALATADMEATYFLEGKPGTAK
ncbi:MAG: hydrolase [Clostridiales bacterium]|nr:hydrolase [Clostridiales bacterium]